MTEDNDPNGKLGKAGGYTSAVFFASPMVDQAAVSGEGVIGKGQMAEDASRSTEPSKTPRTAMRILLPLMGVSSLRDLMKSLVR